MIAKELTPTKRTYVVASVVKMMTASTFEDGATVHAISRAIYESDNKGAPNIPWISYSRDVYENGVLCQVGITMYYDKHDNAIKVALSLIRK